MASAKGKLNDIAKATVATSIAGLTAISGPMQAIASESIVTTSDISVQPVTRATETTPTPTSYSQAKAALEAAKARLAKAMESKRVAEGTCKEAESQRQLAVSASSSAVSLAQETEESAQAAFREAADEADRDVSSAGDAVDAAQKAYKDAKDAKSDADDALAQAKAAVDAAQSAYDAVLNNDPDGKLKEAMEDLEFAKANLEAVSAAANSAQNKLDAAIADRDAKAAAAEWSASAKKSAQKAYDDACAAVDSANSAYASAIAVRDAVDSSEIEEKKIAVDAAKSKLDAAEVDCAKAKHALSQADANQREAYAAFDGAQMSYDEALDRLNAIDVEGAQDAVKAAESALVKARKDEESLDATARDLEQYVSILAEEKDAAEVAYAEAREAADNANAALEAAVAELDKAKANAESASSKVISLYDFIMENGSSYAKAEFDRVDGGAPLTEINKATHPGQAGDATDYRNVLRALQTIRDLNKIRTSLGLSELMVCDDLMVRETVSTNWSSHHLEHSKGSGAENLAWGWDTPLDGWYDTEKAIWDQACVDGAYKGKALPVGWEKMTMQQLAAKAPELFSAVGHYLNVIKPSYRFVGAACSTAEGTYGGICMGQSYRNYTNGFFGTVDEWEARFMAWVNAQLEENPVVTAQANVKSFQDAKTAAYAILDDRREAYELASSKHGKALADAVAARHAATKEAAHVDSLSAALDSATQSLVAAKADEGIARDAVSSALERLNDAIAEKEAADKCLAAGHAAKAAADTAVQTASSDVAKAAAELDAMLSKQNALEKGVADAADILDGVKISRENALNQLNKAIEADLAATSACNESSYDLESAKARSQEIAVAFAYAQDLYQSELIEYEACVAQNDEFVRIEADLARAQADAMIAENSLKTAEEAVTSCEGTLEAASSTYRKALNKLNRAKKLSYVSALEIAIDDPDFSYLNTRVDAVRNAQFLVSKTALELVAAEQAVEKAKGVYNDAYDTWMSVLADVAFYSMLVDQFHSVENVAGSVHVSANEVAPTTTYALGTSASNRMQRPQLSVTGANEMSSALASNVDKAISSSSMTDDISDDPNPLSSLPQQNAPLITNEIAEESMTDYPLRAAVASATSLITLAGVGAAVAMSRRRNSQRG